jgi:hypothetical protein
VSLNDKKTLSMRKLTKLKEIQVDDMETLAKTFSIVATYIVFVEKKSLLNKKCTNHKETNSKTCITTFR